MHRFTSAELKTITAAKKMAAEAREARDMGIDPDDVALEYEYAFKTLLAVFVTMDSRVASL